ncbi:hypothetical protein FRC09_006538 [Ceratobasidium sp. 395]|nr:hypothetical protein FRC09_006538 [Ceratobasidium sp. 395]
MTPNPNLLQYPGLVEVNIQPGDFNSGLTSLQHHKAGKVITRLTGTTKTKKSWSTVQHGVGPEDHIELNSVLVYANHSCSPNTAFDLTSPNKAEWNFRALRDIRVGEELSFFYPSTEWDMDQAFECKCGAENCLGRISGAKDLSRAQLEQRGFISSYISEMLDQRDHKNV